MGEIREFRKCLLVIGVLNTLESDDAVRDILVSEFGPVAFKTVPVPFSFTDYYDSEMGRNPMRYILSFENLVDPEDLSEIKIFTNEIEDRFAVEGNRRINLDPGVLNLGSFILATTKEAGHRIPLKKGIWGETTLIYKYKSYRALDWTYADYRSPEFIAHFNSLRSYYRKIREK